MSDQFDIEEINAEAAPTPPGPFSHATIIGPWVYTSGMGGLDPKTGEVVSDDVVEQTEQAFRNVEAILAAAGCTLADVVKATLYLTDMADYGRVNAVYEAAFAPRKPAQGAVHRQPGLGRDRAIGLAQKRKPHHRTQFQLHKALQKFAVRHPNHHIAIAIAFHKHDHQSPQHLLGSVAAAAPAFGRRQRPREIAMNAGQQPRVRFEHPRDRRVFLAIRHHNFCA